MLEIAEVEIHKEAIVSCPKKDFKPTRAINHCPTCENFKGIGRMSDEGNWDAQYIIRCAHVMERRTRIIEVIE